MVEFLRCNPELDDREHFGTDRAHWQGIRTDGFCLGPLFLKEQGAISSLDSLWSLPPQERHRRVFEALNSTSFWQAVRLGATQFYASIVQDAPYSIPELLGLRAGEVKELRTVTDWTRSPGQKVWPRAKNLPPRLLGQEETPKSELDVSVSTPSVYSGYLPSREILARSLSANCQIIVFKNAACCLLKIYKPFKNKNLNIIQSRNPPTTTGTSDGHSELQISPRESNHARPHLRGGFRCVAGVVNDRRLPTWAHSLPRQSPTAPSASVGDLVTAQTAQNGRQLRPSPEDMETGVGHGPGARRPRKRPDSERSPAKQARCDSRPRSVSRYPWPPLQKE